MDTRFGMSISMITELLVLTAVACGETLATPTGVVEPAPQPTAAPEPAAGAELTPTEPTTPATVTGTVTYRERIALAPNAVVEVKLIDVSRADAPAVTLGEQIIEDPGQVPIAFEIEYDPADIDKKVTYAVQVRIMEGDRLAFINDMRYQVITRDSPTHVDMVLVKVGATPSQPTTP